MKNKKVIFFLILLLNVLFFTVAARLLPFHYEENDDIAMCMIANGSYSGSPDSHLVYINAVYGCLLVLLYKLFGAIEWYTVSFSLLQIISMTVIAYCILTEKESKKIVKGVFLIFFYVIWVRIILTLQFTTTAGLTCFAGCVLLSRKTKFAYIGGGICVAIASLVRFDAAALVALLYIPVFLHDNGFEVKSYIPLVFLLLIVLFFKVSDSFFYRSQGWKEYKQFNEIRGRINDNPNAYKLQKMPQGIDEDDYIMLMYFKPDPSVLTIDAMRQLDYVIQKRSFYDKLKNVKDIRLYLTAIVILTIGFVSLFLTKDKKKILFGITSWLLGLIILIFIAMNGTLKYRVFFCYLIPMVWILYLSVRNVEKVGVFVVVTLICSLLISAKYVKQTAGIRKRDNSWRSEMFLKAQCSLLNEYQRIRANADYRICNWGVEVEFMNPMKIKDSKVVTIGSGWLTNMPFDNSLKSHLDILEDDVVIFTSKNETGEYLLNKLQDCVSRNYGIATKINVVCENDKYKIVKVLNECEEGKW